METKVKNREMVHASGSFEKWVGKSWFWFKKTNKGKQGNLRKFKKRKYFGKAC